MDKGHHHGCATHNTYTLTWMIGGYKHRVVGIGLAILTLYQLLAMHPQVDNDTLCIYAFGLQLITEQQLKQELGIG